MGCNQRLERTFFAADGRGAPYPRIQDIGTGETAARSVLPSTSEFSALYDHHFHHDRWSALRLVA